MSNNRQPTGLLSANVERVSQRLSVSVQHHSEDGGSEIEYPLTPPYSDGSDSPPPSLVNLRSFNLDTSVPEINPVTPAEKEDIQGVKRRRK